MFLSWDDLTYGDNVLEMVVWNFVSASENERETNKKTTEINFITQIRSLRQNFTKRHDNKKTDVFAS